MRVELVDEIGRSIKALRHTRGMTQSELAEESDLDRSYISSIEKGDRNPTVDTIARIAESLNLTFAELMEEATKPISTTSLREAVKGLTEDQVELLREYIKNMKSGLLGRRKDSSSLITAGIYERIGNRLLDRHIRTPHKLNKRQFEYVVVGACKSHDRDASIVQDTTNPGEDIIIGGTAFSLKTEAAQGIREEVIEISKLMEARWIREADTGEDFVDNIDAHVIPHLERYERIIMLRAFDVSVEDIKNLNSNQLSLLSPKRTSHLERVDDFLQSTRDANTYIRYDLVEIPPSLLMRMGVVPASEFKTDYKSGSARVSITEDGQHLFQVFFDGSVEKVTVRNLRVSACDQHASWIVPVRA